MVMLMECALCGQVIMLLGMFCQMLLDTGALPGLLIKVTSFPL